MKIMIKKKDYVRLMIISKKINEQNINDDEIADIKIQFYAYLVILHNENKNFIEASRCYRIIWETLRSTKQKLPDHLDFNFSITSADALSNYVGFLVLHPWSPETEKQLQTLHDMEEL